MASLRGNELRAVSLSGWFLPPFPTLATQARRLYAKHNVLDWQAPRL